jgi:hypothetical protein
MTICFDGPHGTEIYTDCRYYLGSAKFAHGIIADFYRYQSGTTYDIEYIWTSTGQIQTTEEWKKLDRLTQNGFNAIQTHSITQLWHKTRRKDRTYV